ncbi:MAG: gluconokinase, partial [Treponemataceae bacterium]|nr:gluconokinase [Treponemataceae bacterium]
TRSPHPGFAEQNPEEIYQGIKEATKEAVTSFYPFSFAAVSFDTMLHSFLLVDSGMQPLYPLLNWMDTRSAKEVEMMQDAYRQSRFYYQTAVPLHTIFHPPRVVWFQKNQPELWKRTTRILSIKDWVLGRLTGVYACDLSTASATGLVDVQKRCWSEDVLSWLRLPPEKLPELSLPERIESLKKGDFTRDTGLPEGIPVIFGGGDGPFANLGEGAFRPKEMVVTVGSSGAVRMCEREPVFDERGQSWCYYLADGIWVGGGAINNGGIVYSWLRNLLGERQDFALDLYRERPLFLPFLTGERSPNWNPYARGVLFGLSYFHTPEALIQSALEGVAFRVRSIYNMLCRVMGVPHRIVLSGGFATTDHGKRVLCDVLGVPVEVSLYPSASAKGAFLLSLKALGEVKHLADLPSWFFPENPSLEPVEEHKVFYEKLYQLYERVYTQNAPLFKEFVELGLA